MKNLVLITFCFCICLGFAQAQTGKSAEGYPAPAQTKRTGPPPRATRTDDKTAPSVYFNLQLNKLKAAYEAGNLSDLIANEQKVQDLLRKQTLELEAKIAKNATTPTASQQRLEQMKRILAAFDGHSFDLGKPAEAKKDFALLDEFARALEAEVEVKD